MWVDRVKVLKMPHHWLFMSPFNSFFDAGPLKPGAVDEKLVFPPCARIYQKLWRGASSGVTGGIPPNGCVPDAPDISPSAVASTNCQLNHKSAAIDNKDTEMTRL